MQHLATKSLRAQWWFQPAGKKCFGSMLNQIYLWFPSRQSLKIHVYLYIYIYICTHVYIYIYTCIYIYIYISAYVDDACPSVWNCHRLAVEWSSTYPKVVFIILWTASQYGSEIEYILNPGLGTLPTGRPILVNLTMAHLRWVEISHQPHSRWTWVSDSWLQ